MEGPTPAQLDDFERRLAALTAEFEELKRRADGGAAPPEPPPLPEWLAELDQLFRAGPPRKALREAERLREKALKTHSHEQLAELLAYLGTVTVPDEEALARIRYAATQNIAFLEYREAKRRPPGGSARAADDPASTGERPLPFPVRTWTPPAHEDEPSPKE